LQNRIGFVLGRLAYFTGTGFDLAQAPATLEEKKAFNGMA